MTTAQIGIIIAIVIYLIGMLCVKQNILRRESLPPEAPMMWVIFIWEAGSSARLSPP